MTTRPSLRQIEAFRAVVLIGSISGGAAHLGLTQPAVSRLIRDLEYRIGLTLFERRGNAVQANAEALLLYKEVEQQFLGLDRIEVAVRHIREAQLGSIRIAAFTGAAIRFLPHVTARYLDTHPGARVTLQSTTSPGVLDGVSLRRFELGMAHSPAAYLGIEAEAMEGLSAVCAVPANHPLAARPEIGLDDLHGVPLLSLGQSSPIWSRLTALLQSRSVEPMVLVEANASESLCTLAAMGKGIAIIDPFTAAHLDRPEVALKPLVPAINYPVSLIFNKGLPRSRMVEEFAGLIRTEAALLAERWRPQKG
ncbi:LysR substrate-binding domain-containing protein [Limobrevibacterium gyesilva]|uniref:LysR substrate-binding domain-containing protein n=1 Tax=Limobrevibacterium gyesilva TaxID=2991712 RepID=A0AA41YLA0_9PROT|nr:LysR substrate-binding domain-containing protein [Limobrevibacterium gyesilva]MCW3475509.1 LysR substrate-binding domain-containing protein [Limobrevibacterium gyesilva]